MMPKTMLDASKPILYSALLFVDPEPAMFPMAYMDISFRLKTTSSLCTFNVAPIVFVASNKC